MRYAVIGAGISGLAAAHELSAHHVTVYEGGDRPGGLIRCDDIDGALFHTTGGHVFNTKHPSVLDWFWRFFDRDREFLKADRNAAVLFSASSIVGYPIENHVYQLSDEVLRSFIGDLQSMLTQSQEPQNFEQFLIARFGPTLYRLYFQPYNRKVWRRDLSQVPLSWLEGKLPMPTVVEMIYNNIRQVKEKQFVHSTFYYPRQGGSQFIADRLARGLDIRYRHPVAHIERRGQRWIVEGEEYDKVIFTGNVKELPSLLGPAIDLSGYAAQIQALEAHGTTSVFCAIDPNPYSWIYLPSFDYEAHRIICTGNFSPANNPGPWLTATIEFTDYISHADILHNLSRMPYHPEYITHNYAQYTYPIQSADTREMIRSLRTHLAPQGLYLVGRFAEWEYYNMDAAIASVLALAPHL